MKAVAAIVLAVLMTGCRSQDRKNREYVADGHCRSTHYFASNKPDFDGYVVTTKAHTSYDCPELLQPIVIEDLNDAHDG
jgi:hypothetical protein